MAVNIVTRQTGSYAKNSTLTNTELDTNFINLKDAVDNVTVNIENTKSSIRPSLLLDFANLKRLDKRITFTRASIGTRYNADGLLERVEAGKPRFDHDPITKESLGLLIEEQRTNLLTYSENFDNAAWLRSGATVTANSTTAPDGTLTAESFIESTSSLQYLTYSASQSLANKTFTTSIYIKKLSTGSTRGLKIQFTDNVAYVSASKFDLDTKQIIYVSTNNANFTNTSSTITEIGNGWIRCTLTTTRGNLNVDTVLTHFLDNGTTVSYTGDGTSGLYIWGAQLEEGAFATSYIPSNDTFTSRASTATYIGSDGLIKTAAIDTARYNYNPMNLKLAPKLLLEPAATNLLTYSEQFNNAVWENAGGNLGIAVTANNTTSPDGNTTADKITNDGGGTSLFQYTLAVPASNITDYTASIFVKAGTATTFVFNMYYVNNTEDNLVFNLSTGTYIGGDTGSNRPSIIPVGNGWYRISYVITRDATNSRTSILFRGWGINGVVRGSGVIGEYYYAWGAQLEVGTTATSYIPTTSSQVTRSADVSSSGQYTRLADSAEMLTSTWFNKDEGSFLTTLSNVSNPAGSIVMVDKGLNSWSGRIQMSMNSSLTVVQTNIVNDAGGIDVQLSTTGLKTVFAYKTNDCANSANDSIIATDSSATLPTSLTKMHIGKSPVSNYILDGTLAKLAYYPKRLSNAELQSLTGG